MWIFCFHLNSKSYPIILPDMFPLGIWSRLIAIRYASYRFQNRSVPALLRYKNHAEINLFQWKQKAYLIWKLERSDNDPVWWKHSIFLFSLLQISFCISLLLALLIFLYCFHNNVLPYLVSHLCFFDNSFLTHFLYLVKIL